MAKRCITLEEIIKVLLSNNENLLLDRQRQQLDGSTACMVVDGATTKNIFKAFY